MMQERGMTSVAEVVKVAEEVWVLCAGRLDLVLHDSQWSSKVY